MQAVGAMVIFNLNDLSSFKDIEFWISKLKELSGNVPYVLVGNKSDLERNVDKAMVDDEVKRLGVQYFETSAKLDENVNLAFESLSIQILNNMK